MDEALSGKEYLHRSRSTVRSSSNSRNNGYSAPVRWALILSVLALLLVLCWQEMVVELWMNAVRTSVGIDPFFALQPCPETNNGAQCGHIEVPKDYTGHTTGFSLIAFARYPAKQKPSKGTIFLNSGGPGAAGKRLVTETGTLFAELLGDQWDLVAFDPRGVGETIPSIHCFSSSLEHRMFKANTVFEQGLIVPANVSAPSAQDFLRDQYRQWLFLKQTQAEHCRNTVGEELMYSGTTTVAKDIQYMKSFFDQKGKINYWGGSYGTILGAYLMNMFPEEMGLVALDGVTDPVIWSNEPSHKWPKQWVSHAEKTYQIFLSQCVEAGTEGCALAREGQSAADLEKRIDKWFDELITTPLPVPEGSRPGVLTSGGARTVIFMILNHPEVWQSEGALIINDAMNRYNGTAMYNILVPPPHGTGKPDISAGFDLARLAVSCLDSPAPSFRSPKDAQEELLREGMEALAVSRFGMSTTVQEPDGGCQFWPVRPKERFTGPWNSAEGVLETPVLIVANTADPITPISSAVRLNSLLPNSSRMLIYDAPGHCSLSVPSPCPINHVKRYFAGITPDNGTFCESPGSMFPSTSNLEANLPGTQFVETAQKIAKVLFDKMTWY